MTNMSIIAMITDFGMHDHYVAAMKGMILQINPRATLVDVAHEIGPHAIDEAAFILRQVFPYYPQDTIFVVVVDPTVGTNRRILAARYSDRIVLAPDNGIVTFLHRDAELQEIRVVENRRYQASSLSATFHGRDIFAPVAAHLSRGLSMDQLGPVADHIEVLQLARAHHHKDGTIEGQVLFVDRFGNLITNISERDLSAANSATHRHDVFVGSHKIGPIHITYADVPKGEPVALIGSTQMLEIAVNNGNAAKNLNVSRGDSVSVRG